MSWIGDTWDKVTKGTKKLGKKAKKAAEAIEDFFNDIGDAIGNGIESGGDAISDAGGPLHAHHRDPHLRHSIGILHRIPGDRQEEDEGLRRPSHQFFSGVMS